MMQEQLDFFEEKGYFIFKSLIDEDTINKFWAEFEYLIETNPDIEFSKNAKIYRKDQISADERYDLRVINLLSLSLQTRLLSTENNVMSFINKFYNEKLACIQSLAYSKSSRQGPHSDKYLVSPPYIGKYNRNTLCAAWFACVDTDESNGALEIFPGSHKVENKPLLKNFQKDYKGYSQSLIKHIEQNGCKKEVFRAQKGDVLIWHGDFVHGGGKPLDDTKSRSSLVCHYARVEPKNVSGTILLNGEHKIYQR